MMNQEVIEDCLIPFTMEHLETAWMLKQSEIRSELSAKAEAYKPNFTKTQKAISSMKKNFFVKPPRPNSQKSGRNSILNWLMKLHK